MKSPGIMMFYTRYYEAMAAEVPFDRRQLFHKAYWRMIERAEGFKPAIALLTRIIICGTVFKDVDDLLDDICEMLPFPEEIGDDQCDVLAALCQKYVNPRVVSLRLHPEVYDRIQA